MKMLSCQVLAAIGVGFVRSSRAFIAPLGASAALRLSTGAVSTRNTLRGQASVHSRGCACARCAGSRVVTGLRMMSTETEVKAPPVKLYIGNLGWDTTSEDLQNSFSGFGQMSDCYVVVDRSTGESRGFGFVSFATEDEARRAVEAMNGKDMDGRKIRVDISKPKQPASPEGDSSKLYIGNLGFDTTNQELSQALAQYGNLKDVIIVTDRETGNSRGFAFATFGSPEEAKAAADALDGTEMGGRDIRVNISRPKVERTNSYGDSGYGGGGGGGYGGGNRDNYSAPVDNTKIFVGNLGWDTTTEDLQRAFSQYGSLEECKVVTDRDTGNSRGFGFVSFKDGDSAEKAIAAMDGNDLGGREIRVNISQPKKPRYNQSYDEEW